MACKVLITDDEPDFLETWARLLQRVGYVCLTAESVASALELVDSEAPDLVITDLNFPAGSGFELVHHVRSSVRRTPVIVITAYHSRSAEKAAVSAGAAAYLTKPLSANVLTAAITEVLNGHGFPMWQGIQH